MDAAGVDVAVVSLTCPNVFWGGAEISLKAARVMNDEMARAQTATRAHPLVLLAAVAAQKLALAELKRALHGGRRRASWCSPTSAASR